MNTSNSIAVALFTIISTNICAQNVLRINKKKRFVLIDQGKNFDINRKDKICFYDEDDQKIACGLVKKVGKTKSVVIVRKKHIGLIEIGMTCKFPNKDPQEGLSQNQSQTNSENHEPSEEKEISTTPENPTEASEQNNIENSAVATPMEEISLKRIPKMNLRLLYIISPTTEFHYAKMEYFYVENSPDKVYTPADNSNQSMVGAGIEFSYRLLKNLDIVLGVNYKIMKKIGTDSDAILDGSYSVPAAYQNQIVSTRMESYSLGSWLDIYYYKVPLAKNMLIKLGAGINMAYNKLSFEAVHKNENDPSTLNTLVAEAFSSVNSVGLRLPIDTNYFFGKFAIGIRFVAMYNFINFSKKDQSKITGPSLPGLNIQNQSSEILLGDIDHKQSGFSIEIPITASYYF